MSEQKYPSDWLIEGYDPQKHLMQIKGKDYLDVKQRMIWFISHQREMIAAGIATTSHTVQTELVELDRQNGWAHFKTYVRDVLGNEATMYGSESIKDFPDYIEKASTKSLGRALLMLGYGTAFADEFGEVTDDKERPVDAPVQRAPPPRPTQVQQTRPAPPVRHAPAPTGPNGPATDKQIEGIKKLRRALKREEPQGETLTFEAAKTLLTSLSQEYNDSRQAVAS